MAAGKTTVGRLLARRTGRRFLDLDDLVTERAGLTPAELIRERGEPALRALEAELTAELAGRSGVVLATGGGWGSDPGHPAGLGPDTVRIWLRVSAAEAVRRAAADNVDRPMLGDAADPEARLARARSLLARREAGYAAAELVVDVEDRQPGEVVEEIIRRLAGTWEDDER